MFAQLMLFTKVHELLQGEQLYKAGHILAMDPCIGDYTKLDSSSRRDPRSGDCAARLVLTEGSTQWGLHS